MSNETCACSGCRKLRAAWDEKRVAPLVGALVEVTLSGEVASKPAGDGFWLKTGGEGLAGMTYWIPSSAAYVVLKPPRPREVLLLECGHVSQKKRPESPSELIFCTPCMKRQPLEAIGSVTW